MQGPTSGVAWCFRFAALARGGLPVVMAVAMLQLAGCEAIKNNGEDVNLLQLGGLLQGRFDNAAQIEADQHDGRAPHEATRVVIVQLNSLTVGEHAYYMEQTDTGTGRVTGQRVFSLQSVTGGVLEMVWSLVEPARWRGAADQPELLSALQYKDLKQLVGCSLVWKKEGDTFSASNDMAHCNATPSEAHGAVYAKWRLELTSDTLSLSEQAYDPDQKLVAGREDEPFLRLRRTAN